MHAEENGTGHLEEDAEESPNLVEDETDSGIVENPENIESGETAAEELGDADQDQEKVVEEGLEPVVEEPLVIEDTLEAEKIATSEENDNNGETPLEENAKDVEEPMPKEDGFKMSRERELMIANKMLSLGSVEVEDNDKSSDIFTEETEQVNKEGKEVKVSTLTRERELMIANRMLSLGSVEVADNSEVVTEEADQAIELEESMLREEGKEVKISTLTRERELEIADRILGSGSVEAAENGKILNTVSEENQQTDEQLEEEESEVKSSTLTMERELEIADKMLSLGQKGKILFLLLI